MDFKTEVLNKSRMLVTCGIDSKLKSNAKFAAEVIECIKKYHEKDWGDLTDDDKKLTKRISTALKICIYWLHIIHAKVEYT